MNKFYEQLRAEIQASYEQGVTLTEAEMLSAKFLDAQLRVADGLRQADLDARMRKAGLKAIKAAVYLEEAKKGDKKPSDVFIASVVDRHELVLSEQTAFDEAEVHRDHLQNYLQVFREAHVHFRQLSKGRFE